MTVAISEFVIGSARLSKMKSKFPRHAENSRFLCRNKLYGNRIIFSFKSRVVKSLTSTSVSMLDGIKSLEITQERSFLELTIMTSNFAI